MSGAQLRCATRAAADPIPAALNLVLVALALGLALACLWLASHALSLGLCLAAAFVFSYANHTLFALLHEAVHGVLHPDRRVNEALGRVLAAMFPTGLGLQRAFHLGHHRRNRTPAEQFDYLRPGDRPLLKRAQWYAILTGLYWAFVPLGALAYLVSPRLFRARGLRGTGALARQTSAEAMFAGLDGAPSGRLRLEILFSLALQAALAAALGLSLGGWLLCYAAFAVNWSSLQYADHAFSRLDVREGAWDLRVNPLVRLVLLNYTCHRAHHKHPEVPWIHLPRHVDERAVRPAYLATWLAMWAGPRPLPAGEAGTPAEGRR